MVISEVAALCGFTPPAVNAADRPLARSIAFDIRTIDRFAVTNPITIRGAISLAEYEVCSVSWLITMIPPMSTSSP